MDCVLHSMSIHKRFFTQLCSKKEMYRELKKYVKRDQLYSAESKKEDFEKFVDKHNSFLYKPDVADCGRGIEKWTVSKEVLKICIINLKKVQQFWMN